MKPIALKKGIVNNYKEQLLFVYAFLNTKSLYKPECGVLNDYYKGPEDPNYIFGKNAVTKVYGGLDDTIPSWESFYKFLSNKDSTLVCCAGCDDKDSTRITLQRYPKSMLPENFEYELPITISEEVGKKKIDNIINDIISNYNKYKEEYYNNK